jgi:rare lipoprotein A
MRRYLVCMTLLLLLLTGCGQHPGVHVHPRSTPTTSEPATSLDEAAGSDFSEQVALATTTTTIRASRGVPRTPPATARQPQKAFETPTPTVAAPTPSNGPWRAAQASWYGPGFYGHGTACGQRYSSTIIGVAHLTLPCGTLVTFEYSGHTITAPVIDRGPYVKGRMWDLSQGACRALAHCFTGVINYRIGA